MGKKIKRGKEGPQKEYVSRTKAIKKLQVNLKDFRRLCILKGVYPRDPPKKLRKQHKTYYHIKDINFLGHESVLDKFRERKAHLKKVRKAISRGEKLKAIRLKARTPAYNLDHLVKERYPTFQDALNDLDDPLCMINLFSSFAAHKELKIPNTLILNCSKLQRQFMLYVAKSNSLRKVFLSIKGIYYQAIVQGATITWIVPYPVQAQLPFDVDYKVMITFLEFYQVLMRFVNFKLLGREVDVSTQYYIGHTLKALNKEQELQQLQIDDIDEKFKEDQAIQQMQQQQQELKKYSEFFKGFLFFLYPETPKISLEFVILSFGGQVCWIDDGQNINENDPRITHVVTERIITNPNKKREYIQPQWIYDSINQLKLLSVKDYGPDKILPPHLSPFEEQQEEITKQVILEEEEEDIEQEEGDVVVEKLKLDKARQAKKQALDKQKKDQEEKRLAETMLTKKNKRLYDMIKRKEQEKEEKVQKLKQKKK